MLETWTRSKRINGLGDTFGAHFTVVVFTKPLRSDAQTYLQTKHLGVDRFSPVLNQVSEDKEQIFGSFFKMWAGHEIA